MLHILPDNASKVALIQQVDTKLTFIPIMFIFLRIWGTLEFIVTESSCNPGPAIAGFLSALRFLQVIFVITNNHNCIVIILLVTVPITAFQCHGTI